MELAAAAAIISTVATIGQTVSQVQAARTQAKFAGAEAASAREAAAAEEASFRRRAARVMAQGRAIGAAAGLDIASGSPLLLELENVREGELTALRARHAGELAAAGKRTEAQLARQSIAGTVFGGAAQTGSVLSSWVYRGR